MSRRKSSGGPGDIVQLTHNVDLFWFERVNTAKSAETLRLFLDLVHDFACPVPGNGKAAKIQKVHVLVVAGEATQAEYGAAEDLFKKSLELPNVTMEMVAGPVLNADRKEDSTVLRLAEQYPKRFTFYRVTMREDDHWKIAFVNGEARLIQLECPHLPAPIEDCYKATLTRDAYFFTSQPEFVLDYDEKKRPFASVFKAESSVLNHRLKWVPAESPERETLREGFANEVKAHTAWFDRYRAKHLASKRKLGYRNAEVLPTAKIQRAYKRLKRRGRLYDFSTAREILQSVGVPTNGET